MGQFTHYSDCWGTSCFLAVGLLELDRMKLTTVLDLHIFVESLDIFDFCVLKDRS
jgi:hypothetical protein